MKYNQLSPLTREQLTLHMLGQLMAIVDVPLDRRFKAQALLETLLMLAVNKDGPLSADAVAGLETVKTVNADARKKA